MSTTKVNTPVLWWAIVLAALLLLPTFAVQQAWADDAPLAASGGQMQTQAAKFEVQRVKGGVKLTYVGTSKTVKVPKTYGGKKVVSVMVHSGKVLKKFDASKATYLKELLCLNNKLPKLDVSKNRRLTFLYCYNNRITKLDVSKNRKLISLECAFNKLTELDVSKNAKLYSLSCAGNKLTKLDVSKNRQLVSLSCYKNKLTELDVSRNKKLGFLDCSDNRFTAKAKSKLVKWGKSQEHELTI